jgi:nicotinamide-nucleotide amidase
MVQQAILDKLAFRTFDLLREKRQVLVTAESCTAGLISATLSRVPGISVYLAGAFVVYQVISKVKWLDIPAEMISRHDVVSAEVAELMATNALKQTDHATIAVSITGHLGPDAPETLDGVAWLGYATRLSKVRSVKLNLCGKFESGSAAAEPLHIRHERQQVAVLESLGFLCDRLAEMA